MRILEVVEACSGGVGRHVRGLCRDLAEQGHRLTLAYAPHRADEPFKRFLADHREKIRFVPLEMKREVSPSSDLKALFQLMRLIEREGPYDVVHGHSSKGGAIARIAGRRFGLPTVYTPHGLIMASPVVPKSKAAVYGSIERALGRWATSKIIAVSEGERRFIIERGLVPAESICVVQNGVDDEDLRCLAKTLTYEGLDQKPLTFGSTMRFDALKAPDHLVEAFIRLRNLLPQLPMRLVVAGDGELFTKVEERTETGGVDKEVSLLGWRTDIAEVLRELDVFVVSSRSEAGSYSILEAMAAALPVVSTRVIGTDETVFKVPGNILVPVGDPGALADGMKRMATLAEPGSLRLALREIGQANREYVLAHFRQSETTRRILEVYRALC